jgi:hypothetical protein
VAGPQSRIPLLAALGAFAGYVVLLVTVPRWIPMHVPPDVVSAAAAQGYNTEAAYWLTLAWSLAIVAGAALIGRRSSAPAPTEAPPPGRLKWIELGVVFLVGVLAYFPVFMARGGTYSEDQYFLTILQRMGCGQLPYRDFDYSYGPLMIYPVWGWSRIFGVSMVSYYAFVALYQGLQLALLMGALQLFIADRWRRYLAYLLLLPFLVNSLMGLNEDGIRRLAPIIALLITASRPFDWRANLASAAILGLALAYSEECAVAALMGAGAIYAVSLLGEHRMRALRSGLIVAGAAALVWAVSAWLAVGGVWGDYISSRLGTLARMSAGHAGFSFYWTVNSLASFGILTIACIVVGAAFGRGRRELQAGDRMFLGALIFALVILKSGINRSDPWHFHAVILALLFAFLLKLPTTAVEIRPETRRWTMALIVVAAVTQLVGLAPMGSLLATSWLHGIADTVAGRPAAVAQAPASERPAMEFERTEPRPHFVALSRYLAAPERRGRPVLFYGRSWVAAAKVGVCSRDYKTDDVMYYVPSDPERRFLEQHPDALVVLHRTDYRHLYLPPEQEPPPVLTPMQQAGRWLATTHYDSGPTENRLQEAIRDRATGDYVRSHYRVAADFGLYVVVEPTAAPRAG